MRRVHRSKPRARRGICRLVAAGALLPLLAFAACSTRNVLVNQAIEVYAPKACGPTSGVLVTYTGLGDFEPESPPAETVPLDSTGFSLAQVSPASRAIVLGPVAASTPWAGTSLVPASGPIALLALPLDHACPLSATVNLGGDLGVSLGLADPTHALIVGGTTPPFVVDLSTGLVTELRTGLMPQREYATVTPFGSGALIAGGEDPVSGEAQQTAVVYTPGSTPAAGTFSAPILLAALQREKHGAVALPDGRVLLVGGANDQGTLVRDLEVVDPTTQAAKVVGTLQVPRTNPTVIALATGQVFIGGGFDASGKPVRTIEWLTRELAAAGTIDLCAAGPEQGFAATEEGAVLAVMGPAPGTAACSNVHLIRPGIVEEASVLDASLGTLHLFQGAEASPVLLTDTTTLRWNPWTATFTSLGAAASGLSVPRAVLNASSGLALWLGTDNQVWTLRFDTRGPYATDFVEGPYLVTDDKNTAPDRLPGADASFTVEGGATLAHGASLFVTDATYETVTVSVDLPEGGEVALVLRDPTGTEFTCTAAHVPVAHPTAEFARTGASVTVRVGGGAASPCVGSVDATARLAVGLRSLGDNAPPTVLRKLNVTR